MNLEIRQLRKDDVALMYSMLSMFGRAFEDIETYETAQPSREYLAKLLSNNDFIAIAAIDGEKTVGGIAAYVLHKFEQERNEIYIYDLAVDENFRRRGIAARMIEKLREIARKRGVWVIYVQADSGDEPAIALYSKLGQREDVLHFDILPKKANS